MAALEENNALFPIFILTIMALALVPYAILKLCRAASKHTRASIASAVTALIQPFFKRILNFSTYRSLSLVVLWVVMIVLVYYIKTQSVEGFEMGIAPPQFPPDTRRNGGILFLGIVGVDILLPLVIASCCISLKVGKIYRQLCHAVDVVHLLLLYEAFSGSQQSNGRLHKGC